MIACTLWSDSEAAFCNTKSAACMYIVLKLSPTPVPRAAAGMCNRNLHSPISAPLRVSGLDHRQP